MKEHIFTSEVLGDVLRKINDAERDGIDNYRYEGRDFIIHSGVFPPTHFQSTGIFTRLLPYPQKGSFLEIGCGAGVTAVMAALAGCSRVVATDISEAAVNNTRLNVKHQGVEHIVSTYHSDLFDALDQQEKFDTIFWNSNFVFVPDGYVFDKTILHAFCDVGYATHHRFLHEAKNYLAPGGELLLGFSSQGDAAALEELLNQYGYRSEIIASESCHKGKQNHFYIIKLVPQVNAHQEVA